MWRYRSRSLRGAARSEEAGASDPRGGFTLIELLIVVAIIGILVSLLLVAVTHALRRARIVECKTNLREIGIHLMIHVQRNKRYPQFAGPKCLQILREPGKNGQPPLIQDADKLFVCPMTGTEPGPEAIDFRGPIEILTESKIKHSTPIACDKEENHGPEGSINVLYPNGRVDEVYREQPAYAEALSKTTP